MSAPTNACVIRALSHRLDVLFVALFIQFIDHLKLTSVLSKIMPSVSYTFLHIYAHYMLVVKLQA